MLKAKCKNCGDTVISIGEPDEQCCSCFKDQANLIHGIYLDDTGNYGTRILGNLNDIIWENDNEK